MLHHMIFIVVRNLDCEDVIRDPNRGIHADTVLVTIDYLDVWREGMSNDPAHEAGQIDRRWTRRC